MESDSEVDLSGTEDFSSKQEFNKIERNLISSGFREGAAAGKDASFQSGFDAGYAEGFQTAFSLGRFNGVTEILKKNAESLSLDPSELDGCSFKNSRLGLCQICDDSKDQSKCSCKKVQDVTSLSLKQKELSRKIYDEHSLKYVSAFQKAGVPELLKRAGNDN